MTTSIQQTYLAFDLPARGKKRAKPASKPASKGVLGFILACTLLYLSIELPFAALLVDTLATAASMEEVHRLENMGRFISGAALALAAWGFILPRAVRKRSGAAWTAIQLLGSAAICIAIMVFGQRTLIDAIADNSTTATRQAALKASIARSVLLDDPAAFKEIALPADHATSPAWSAFKGNLVFLGWNDADILKRLEGNPTAIIDKHARSSFPSADEFKRSAYEPAMAELKRSFDSYREGVRKFEATRKDIPNVVRNSWNRYFNGLRRQGIRNFNNPSMNERIAQRVRQDGVPVPRGWHPLDRQGFESALASQIIREAESRYKSSVEGALGADTELPKNLARFDDFVVHKAIQERLKQKLSIPASAPLVKANMADAAFRQAAYMPAQNEAARILSQGLGNNAAQFSRGEPLEESGKSAVRLAVAPLLALVLSALGALGHLAKTANHLAALALPRLKPGLRAGLVLAGLAASVALLKAPAEIAGSGLWGDMRAAAAAKGPVDAGLIDVAGWSIGAHDVLHPLGRFLESSPTYTGTNLFLTAIGAI